MKLSEIKFLDGGKSQEIGIIVISYLVTSYIVLSNCYFFKEIPLQIRTYLSVKA